MASNEFPTSLNETNAFVSSLWLYLESLVGIPDKLTDAMRLCCVVLSMVNYK